METIYHDFVSMSFMGLVTPNPLLFTTHQNRHSKIIILHTETNQPPVVQLKHLPGLNMVKYAGNVAMS